MKDVDELLEQAGAAWRATRPEPRAVSVPEQIAQPAFISSFLHTRFLAPFGSLLLASLLGVTFVGSSSGKPSATPDADQSSAAACAAFDIWTAAATLDTQHEEGFGPSQLARARDEGAYLKAVALAATAHLQEAPGHVVDPRIVAALDAVTAAAKTLAEVGAGAPGVDPDSANVARADVRAAVGDLAVHGGGATADCALTAVPSSIAEQPPTAPPPATALPLADGVASRSVQWSDLPTPGVLRDLQYVTPSFGWVKTNIDLRLTADGGKTWLVSRPRDLQRDPFADAIVFADPTHGWLMGLDASGSTLKGYRTVDGGRHWSEFAPPWQSLTPSLQAQLKLRYEEGILIASTGPSAVYASTDGGDHWTDDLAAGVPTSIDVTFRHGAANGSDGVVAFVHRPGASDARAELPEPASFRGTQRWPWPLAARMLDSERGVAVVNWMGGGASNVPTAAVYRTNDGGASWSTASLVHIDAVSSVIFDAANWTIVGDGAESGMEVATSSDAGEVWRTHHMSFLGAVQMWASWADPANGWVMVTVTCGSACEHGVEPGKSDVVMATHDRGATWSVITPPE